MRSNAVRRAALSSQNAWLAAEANRPPPLHVLRLLFAVACNIDLVRDKIFGQAYGFMNYKMRVSKSLYQVFIFWPFKLNMDQCSFLEGCSGMSHRVLEDLECRNSFLRSREPCFHVKGTHRPSP